MNLKLTKQAWTEIGEKAGWYVKPQLADIPKVANAAPEISLGWTLEKRAEDAQEIEQQNKVLQGSCSVCGATWEQPKADPNLRCPNCGAPKDAVQVV